MFVEAVIQYTYTHKQYRVSMQRRHTNNRPFVISVWKIKVRKRNTEE